MLCFLRIQLKSFDAQIKCLVWQKSRQNSLCTSRTCTAVLARKPLVVDRASGWLEPSLTKRLACSLELAQKFQLEPKLDRVGSRLDLCAVMRAPPCAAKEDLASGPDQSVRPHELHAHLLMIVNL
jgi:hypothetical protein